MNIHPAVIVSLPPLRAGVVIFACLAFVSGGLSALAPSFFVSPFTVHSTAQPISVFHPLAPDPVERLENRQLLVRFRGRSETRHAQQNFSGFPSASKTTVYTRTFFFRFVLQHFY
jgi:hypothetical protein